LASYDKKRQADAGLIPGTNSTPSEIALREKCIAELNAKLSSDSQSDAQAPKPQQTGPIIDVESIRDTTSAPTQPALPPAQPVAGGGSDFGNPSREVDTLASKIFTAKDDPLPPAKIPTPQKATSNPWPSAT
jgi:hypothetical protein